MVEEGYNFVHVMDTGKRSWAHRGGNLPIEEGEKVQSRIDNEGTI